MKKILFITLILAGSFISCDDEKLIEMNRPKKNAAKVPGELLFTNGSRNMFDLMTSTDVNVNVFRLYSQYWAQTTYPDESQYNMVSREIPDNFWEAAYRDALKDLDEAGRVIEEDYESLGMSEGHKNNQIAIINIHKAYLYTVLIDVFGAVPFSEALSEENLLPKYDPGQDVYSGAIDMLNSAIGSINLGEPGFSETQDPIYQGDMEGWQKFANSLKLRIAITIEDVDASKAQAMVTEALAGGIIDSNDFNASITYENSAPNTNPVWEDLVQSGREDYVVANTLVDKLNALDDPRLPVFAEPLKDGTTFQGGEYGTGNVYADNSHIGDLFHQPNLEGVVFDYAEVEFLLAEAIERGLTGVPGTAAEHYTEGIRASMEYWGVDDADINAYLAQPDVAYATAAGTWKQKIGSQLWIAYYNRGYEGWTMWRRLDFEGFNVPDGLAESDIPKRMIFPIEEATLNPTALTTAIQTIGGADDVQTKVFWDMN